MKNSKTELAKGMERLERQFMTPCIWQGECWQIDTRSDGVVTVPTGVASKTELREQYPVEKCYGPEITLESGWFAQLSASGYTDQTDIAGPFDTEEEAERYLVETYDDDDDMDDDDDSTDDDEPTEPEDGDYTLSPCGPLGSRTSVVRHNEKRIGEYADDEQAEQAIRDDAGGNYFPNVWRISDHGNAHLITDWSWDTEEKA